MCEVGWAMSKIEDEIEAYKKHMNKAKELGVVMETYADKRSTLYLYFAELQILLTRKGWYWHPAWRAKAD